MPKILTTEEIKEKVIKNFNGYEIISEYNGSDKPIIIKHKCGNIYTIKRAKVFLNENGGLCPKCTKNIKHSTKRISEEEFIKRIKEIYNNEYNYISGYKNTSTKCLIRHNKCGYEWLITPKMLIGSKKRGCPKCGNLSRGKYLLKDNYLNNILKDSNTDNEYKWLEDYKGNNKLKHLIKHNVCNKEYFVRPNDFQQGYRCPYCSRIKQESNEEQDFKNFIKSNYNKKIIENYRDGNKEIDIFIPDLKIGFEYNGFYWHCDRFKDKYYHLNKLEYFNKKEIRVYFIDSIDWITKRKILENKILNILRISKGEKLSVKKCSIEYTISDEEEREFLNNNHIQGFSPSSFKIGLKYKEELVSIITFSKDRVNENNSIELLRYCTNLKYIIIGDFSKLLKYAIFYIKNNYKEIKSIITYVDRNLSDDCVYVLNGFVLDYISEPSYFYVKNNIKINRFYNDDLTEFEITDKVKNLYRI